MRWTFAIAALALVAAGCDNVQYIEITPAQVTLRTKTDSVWLHALGKSQTGRDYPKADMTWSSKDPSIATVDDTGKVFAKKSGQTQIVVSHGKVSASVPVDVLLAEKLTVEPSSITLKDGADGVELTTHVYDFRGKELKDRAVTFMPKDQKIANMGGNKVFPVTPGKTQVLVRVEDLTQPVDVTVEPDKTARK